MSQVNWTTQVFGITESVVNRLKKETVYAVYAELHPGEIICTDITNFQYVAMHVIADIVNEVLNTQEVIFVSNPDGRLIIGIGTYFAWDVPSSVKNLGTCVQAEAKITVAFTKALLKLGLRIDPEEVDYQTLRN